MSNIGTPDNQRGVFNPQLVIGSFTTGETSESVGLPPNTESIFILVAGAVAFSPPRVTGNTSGVHYPVSAYPLQIGGSTNPVYVAAVSAAMDPSVTVSWPSGITASWWVVADAGVRQVIDPALVTLINQVGTAVQAFGVLMMGTDGTDARVIKVDANGRISRSGANASVEVAAATGTLLAAPTAGTINKLYGADLIIGATDSAAVSLTANGAVFAWLADNATNDGIDHVDLGEFEATTAVTMTVIGVASFVTLRYRNEPA